MSLAETQQIMQLCQEIIQLLNTAEIKTGKLIKDLPQTEKVLNNFRQLERVALRYLAIARRMGLPEDAEQAIRIFSQLIVVIRMTQMSLGMLAGGPLGIAMGAAGLIMAGLSASSMLEGY